MSTNRRHSKMLVITSLSFATVLIVAGASAQVVVSDPTWLRSSSVDPGGPGVWDIDAFPYSLPAPGTFTIPPTIPLGCGAATEVNNAAAALGGSPIQSLDNIRYFRQTFSLTTTSVRARIQAAVDNNCVVVLNGQEVGRELDFNADPWSDPYPELTIEADGSITGVNKFDETTPFTTGFVVGVNEIIMVVRNTTGGDCGGFGFRMEIEEVAVMGGDCDLQPALDAIDAVEAKLDANLDANVSSRASQASVDALEVKLDTLDVDFTPVLAGVDALEAKL
ncbi:MAG: hypothetical protein AAF533_28815, partial [Acidobacteriota bacterium]